MKNKLNLNEKELECSKGLSSDEIDAYVCLKDICPNHFKEYHVQPLNLAKILKLTANTKEEKLDKLFVLLDTFLSVDLIFYEEFTYPGDPTEKVNIIFTAFAGLINDGECEVCGSLHWSKHE